MHLIDFSGKFIIVPFYHKNPYKADVMFHNVFYLLLKIIKDAAFNKKELTDKRILCDFFFFLCVSASDSPN